MREFHVSARSTWMANAERRRDFILQAYPNGNSATVVESNQGWPTRDEAQAVADRVNATGDKTGLTFSSYADD